MLGDTILNHLLPKSGFSRFWTAQHHMDCQNRSLLFQTSVPKCVRVAGADLSTVIMALWYKGREKNSFHAANCLHCIFLKDNCPLFYYNSLWADLAQRYGPSTKNTWQENHADLFFEHQFTLKSPFHERFKRSIHYPYLHMDGSTCIWQIWEMLTSKLLLKATVPLFLTFNVQKKNYSAVLLPWWYFTYGFLAQCFCQFSKLLRRTGGQDWHIRYRGRKWLFDTLYREMRCIANSICRKGTVIMAPDCRALFIANIEDMYYPWLLLHFRNSLSLLLCCAARTVSSSDEKKQVSPRQLSLKYIRLILTHHQGQENSCLSYTISAWGNVGRGNIIAWMISIDERHPGASALE